MKISIKESKVNYKQRIVLIIGAAIFLYALLTSPKISIIKSTYIVPSPDKKEIAKIVDLNTAITRAIAILGATLLIFFALKDKKIAQTRSLNIQDPVQDRDCQEDERQRNVITKILKFLKDFF
jgi:hypothetical protein